MSERESPFQFPFGVLVALCELLESRCWMYYDEARREYVSYNFTAELAALGWLPESHRAERIETLGPIRRRSTDA